jgi:hypothetical protein
MTRKAKPKTKQPAAKKSTRGRANSARKPRRAPAKKSSPTAWRRFVAKHGVVLASARGPVPSFAAAVAGEPIVGSWWAHPKGKAIFRAMSELDDDLDIRCFKLVDGKVTFVHRRMWPALVRLAKDGTLPAERVASLVQEHMPTGEHRNIVTPFPDWVSDEVARAADALTVEQAKTQLGAWV